MSEQTYVIIYHQKPPILNKLDSFHFLLGSELLVYFNKFGYHSLEEIKSVDTRKISHWAVDDLVSKEWWERATVIGEITLGDLNRIDEIYPELFI